METENKNEIPKHWRDGFEGLTGRQPTYEEYAANPDMWKEDPDVDSRMALGLAIVTVAAIILSYVL